ncbi:MAG: hypothetical protein OMM_15043, partial [Candidatus Magnetoglobus multicellularis str. Araruama]
RAGNLSEVTTVYAILDNSAPVITGLKNSDIPTKTKHWIWNTEDSDTTVLCRHSVDQHPDGRPSGPFQDQNAIKISDIEGKSFLHVQCQDRTGNLSDVISVYAILDKSPPKIIGLANDDTPCKIKKWEWQSVDNDPNITYRYVIDHQPVTYPAGAFSNQTAAQVSAPDGKWFLHVQAKDTAGNLSKLFTVSAIIDNRAPVLKGLTNDLIPKKLKAWQWFAIDNDP